MGAVGGNKREAGVLAINTDQGVTIAHHHRVLDVTAGVGGDVTITFPAAATMPDGFTCVVRRNQTSVSDVVLAGGISRTLMEDAEGVIAVSSGADWIYYPTIGPQGEAGAQGAQGTQGDESCSVLRMADVAEHLRDPIHTMNEAWRCLRHGGFLFMRIPSTDGRAAFRDPTHVSFWNIESFWYYTQAFYRRFVEPACRCRYQVLRVRDVVQDGILYTEAHLLALHDGPRFHGLVTV